MYEITYERSNGTKRLVVVGANNLLDAQRITKASDKEYVKMVDYRRADGEVYFLRDVR